MTTQETVILHSCLARESGRGGGQRPKRARGRKALTIDIHCHISTPECRPLLRDIFSPEKEPFFLFASPETLDINQRLFAEVTPKLTSPEERLKDMDRMGIDIQAISPSPTQYYYWTDGGCGPSHGRKRRRSEEEMLPGC